MSTPGTALLLQRVRRLAVAAGLLCAAVLACGCGAYRPITVLDEAERAELIELRERVGDRTVHVCAASEAAVPAAGRVAEALLAEGFAAVQATDQAADGELSLEVEGLLDDDLGEPWVTISIVTLGVIPFWTGTGEFRLTACRTPGESPSAACAARGPKTYGLLTNLLRVLPGWQGWALYRPMDPQGAVDARIALCAARLLTD